MVADSILVKVRDSHLFAVSDATPRASVSLRGELGFLDTLLESLDLLHPAHLYPYRLSNLDFVHWSRSDDEVFIPITITLKTAVD